MIFWASKSNFLTTIYLYCIWEVGKDADKMLGVKEQLQTLKFYMLDLKIGHFGQTCQAHYIQYMNFCASKSN